MKYFFYCAGGLGKEVKDIFLRNGEDFSSIQFIDDLIEEKFIDEVSVSNFESFLDQYKKSYKVNICHGEPEARKTLLSKVKKAGVELFSVISENSVISTKAKISDGCTICDFSIVANNAVLAENVLINANSIVGHDISIGSNTVISSKVNIGGNSIIGDTCYIGMGSTIKEGTKIGSNSIIGMGSVVYSDIPDNVIALGNPARVSRRNEAKKVFK